MKLSPNNLRSLPSDPARRLEYSDPLVPGLRLRVFPTGARVWVVAYRWGGRQGATRRYRLGSLDDLSLAQAREAARQVRARVALGEDPQQARNAKREEHRGRGRQVSVTALVTRYLDAAQLRPSTLKEWRRLAGKEIIPALGMGPALGLTRAQIRAWGRTIARRSQYTANRAHELLGAAYAWAVRQELVPGTPFAGLEKPGREKRSERVLSPDELRAVLLALGRFKGHYPDAVRLLILTLGRRGMVLGMTRGELEDLETKAPRWVIPSSRSGTKRRARASLAQPHVVPLSPQALEVVQRRLAALRPGERQLFPQARSRRRGERRKGESAWWSSRFVSGVRQAAQEELGRAFPAWTIHNLRHTGATLMREHLGVSRDLVRLLLGHSAGGDVTGVYDRAEMLGERRAALVAWGTWLERLETEKKGADILPMRREP